MSRKTMSSSESPSHDTFEAEVSPGVSDDPSIFEGSAISGSPTAETTSSSQASSSQYTAAESSSENAASTVSFTLGISEILEAFTIYKKYMKNSDTTIQLRLTRAAALVDKLEIPDEFKLKCACLKLAVIGWQSLSSKRISHIKTILGTFLETLDTVQENENTVSDLRTLLETIAHNNFHLYLSEKVTVQEKQTSMLVKMLKSCFKNLRNDHLSVLQLMREVLQDFAAPWLVTLTKKQSMQRLVEAVDFILMQLVKNNELRKDAARRLLKQCGYHLCKCIREIFSPVLIQGTTKPGGPESCNHVYDILLELVLIDKNLTTGTLNYTECCLNPSRKDRVIGLKFLAQLFAYQNIRGLPNPASFYSVLWTRFIDYCRSDAVLLKEEAMEIAQLTKFIFSQPSLCKTWCSVVIARCQSETRVDCERAFVEGVLVAVKENSSLLLGDTGVLDLLHSLLYDVTVERSCYELTNDLASVTQKAMKSVIDEKCPRNAKIASKILSLIFKRCDNFYAANNKWDQLLTIITEHLIPPDDDVRKKMEKLLFIWMELEFEGRQIFHEIFHRSLMTRHHMKMLLQAVESNVVPLKAKSVFVAINNLLSKMVHWDVAADFFRENIVSALKDNDQMRDELEQILNPDCSCEASNTSARRVSEQLRVGKKKEDEVLNRLMQLIKEVIFDRATFPILLDLVNSCVEGDAVAKQFGWNRIETAKGALRLLCIVMYKMPHLGFTVEALNFLSNWSENTLPDVSQLTLRCISVMARFEKLENFNSGVAHGMATHWRSLVSEGNRSETKMALRCISLHLSTSAHSFFADTYKIIQGLLSNRDSVEDFEHGVSALGHFAAVCPPKFYPNIEDIALSKIADGLLLERIETEESCDSSNNDGTSSNDSLEWWNLPKNILLPGLRTLGRCMRYCGSAAGVKTVLSLLESFITSASEDTFQIVSAVQWDLLRLEAAAAILNICENEKFQPLLSNSQYFMLSRFLLDSRLEVRQKFAEKLRRGLSPYKSWVAEYGRSKGHLPVIMLGYLAFLALEMSNEDSGNDNWAEITLREIFHSRRHHLIYVMYNHLASRDFKRFFDIAPLSLLENSLAVAIPVLAEAPFMHSSDPLDKPVNLNAVTIDQQSLAQVYDALIHLMRMVCDQYTLYPRASTEYVTEMAAVARGSFHRPGNDLLFKRYLAVCEVLQLVVEKYHPHHDEVVSPKVVLPRRFFGGTVHPRSGISSQVTEGLKKQLLRSAVNRKIVQAKSSTVTDNGVEERDSGLEFPSSAHGSTNGDNEDVEQDISISSFSSHPFRQPTAHSTPDHL